MKTIKRINIKKKDIAKKVSNEVGIPFTYALKILNDLIYILILDLLLFRTLKIKHFGSFNLQKKKKRKGKNPKNNISYDISERNVVTFKCSEKLKKKML